MADTTASALQIHFAASAERRLDSTAFGVHAVAAAEDSQAAEDDLGEELTKEVCSLCGFTAGERQQLVARYRRLLELRASARAGELAPAATEE